MPRLSPLRTNVAAPTGPDHETLAVERLAVLRSLDAEVARIRFAYRRALERGDEAWRWRLAERRTRIRLLRQVLRAEVAGDSATASRLARVAALWISLDGEGTPGA